jgi:tripartite-type tricarboxylate transporter receptor subunit TctC
VSGTLDMAILDPITSLPQFRGGRINIFAVMAKSRTATAPEIPTVDEAGAPGLHISPWQAMWAPKDVIAKLNGAVVSTLNDLAIRKKLAEQSSRARDRLAWAQWSRTNEHNGLGPTANVGHQRNEVSSPWWRPSRTPRFLRRAKWQ